MCNTIIYDRLWFLNTANFPIIKAIERAILYPGFSASKLLVKLDFPWVDSFKPNLGARGLSVRNTADEHRCGGTSGKDQTELSVRGPPASEHGITSGRLGYLRSEVPWSSREEHALLKI